MKNEILLILSVFVIYGGVLFVYCAFGRTGLYCYSVVATIAANIEVMILIQAFGMEQTLGNVLFASTFLITDILSETESEKAANQAVWLGIAMSVVFLLFSQMWLLYQPSSNDVIMPAMKKVFSNTPRLMIAGIAVYAIVQRFDVWAYQKWWKFTERLCRDRKKYLWVRNNGSTMISQLLNSILFTVIAFYGIYDWATMLNIIASTYVLYICTSLLDTPVVYLARRWKEKKRPEPVKSV